MKSNLLINLTGAAALTLLLTGCNAANFSSAKAGSEKTGLADGSSSASSVSANDPAIPASCNTELKSRGLKYSGGIWRKRVTVPCGYAGIGYVEADVELEAAADHACENLESLDNRLSGDQADGGFDQGKREGPAAVPQTYAQTSSNHFRWNERSRHCAQSTRCGNSQTQATALGRFAWLKKCEASVPEFKAFLDGLRRVENCDPQSHSAVLGKDPRGMLSGNVCIFSTMGAPFFPQVKLNGSAVDNAPAPNVTAAGQLSKIDQLSTLASQVTDPCPTPAQVAPIDTVCTSGCYRGDQRILTSAEGRYEAILSAKETNSPVLAVLSRTSTIEAPRFVNVKVGRYTASQEESKEILLTFETASGARLVLTTNHPLLDASGVMREASTFKAGESLVKADGGQDEIVSLTRQEFFGKVYNVAPVSIAPEDNLIVSEGLINGSHNFQTVLRSELNRQVLRNNLAKGF